MSWGHLLAHMPLPAPLSGSKRVISLGNTATDKLQCSFRMWPTGISYVTCRTLAAVPSTHLSAKNSDCEWPSLLSAKLEEKYPYLLLMPFPLSASRIFKSVYRNQFCYRFLSAMSDKSKFANLPLHTSGPLDCAIKGTVLLQQPYFNKGSAFSAQEREDFELTGLLPQSVQTLEQQVHRAYQQYSSRSDDLAKNTFLTSMKEQNEVLYFKVRCNDSRTAYTPYKR